jgi:hypothetical protein
MGIRVRAMSGSVHLAWRFALRTRVMLPVLLLLAVLATARGAGSAETPGPRELNVPPIAFLPSNNGAHYAVEEGGLGRLCSLKGASYFVAPLSLPGGATVERVTAFMEDTNRDSVGMMSLLRRKPGVVQILAMTPVSSDGKGLETLSADNITNAVVDNETYAYVLQVMLSGPGVCLRGAQVMYHVP